MNEPTKAIQYLIDTAPLYAKAKADRMFLEEFRKSRKAQLASQAGTEVLGKQDIYAYAHPEYVEILEGIREPLKLEERYRWLMTAAQAKVEVWRTAQYSARIEKGHNLNNKLSAKERLHLARVKNLPCSVCQASGPSEAHHYKQGLQYTCIAFVSIAIETQF